MSLAQATKNLKFDTRMIERSVSTGDMTKEELKKYLETLPDLSHNVEKFTIDGKSSGSADESH